MNRYTPQPMGHSLRACGGILVLLCIGALASYNRRQIRVSTVLRALTVQCFIGATVLFVPIGRDLLRASSDVVNRVLSYGIDGSKFLFGALASDQMFQIFGSNGFVFAFQVLPMIIYVSALISILYYLRIMQAIAHWLGLVFQIVIGVTRLESFSAVTTIFIGQNELPIAIRPYLRSLKPSELFCVMCSGLASVAGSILAGYAGLGVPMEYLLSASVMAVPGGLLYAKIIFPPPDGELPPTETNTPVTEDRPVNIIEAAAIGANNGLRVALAVGAMLIGFIGLLACVNGFLGLVGGLFGNQHLTLNGIFGFVLSPIAYLLGVSWHESPLVAGFIGEKIALNEFVAYSHLSPYLKGAPSVAHALSPRSLAITCFALCGFANLTSIAVLLGSFGPLAPERRPEIAKFGLRAVLAGTLSNLTSAAIAGIFIGLIH